MFNLIPDEVMCYIIEFLDFPEARRLGCVAQRYNSLINQPHLWQREKILQQLHIFFANKIETLSAKQKKDLKTFNRKLDMRKSIPVYKYFNSGVEKIFETQYRLFHYYMFDILCKTIPSPTTPTHTAHNEKLNFKCFIDAVKNIISLNCCVFMLHKNELLTSSNLEILFGAAEYTPFLALTMGWLYCGTRKQLTQTKFETLIKKAKKYSKMNGDKNKYYNINFLSKKIIEIFVEKTFGTLSSFMTFNGKRCSLGDANLLLLRRGKTWDDVERTPRENRVPCYGVGIDACLKVLCCNNCHVKRLSDSELEGMKKSLIACGKAKMLNIEVFYMLVCLRKCAHIFCNIIEDMAKSEILTQENIETLYKVYTRRYDDDVKKFNTFLNKHSESWGIKSNERVYFAVAQTKFDATNHKSGRKNCVIS